VKPLQNVPTWGQLWHLNLILQVHFWWDTWQHVHYYLTSEDYISHRLIATIITYRFCLLVRIKSEKCNWKLYSRFHAFAVCDIYTGMVTGILQCFKNPWSYYLGSQILGNFPFVIVCNKNISWQEDGVYSKKEDVTGNILVVLWQNFLYKGSYLLLILSSTGATGCKKPRLRLCKKTDYEIKWKLFRKTFHTTWLVGNIYRQWCKKECWISFPFTHNSMINISS
jgi:hypothetical protein